MRPRKIVVVACGDEARLRELGYLFRLWGYYELKTGTLGAMLDAMAAAAELLVIEMPLTGVCDEAVANARSMRPGLKVLYINRNVERLENPLGADMALCGKVAAGMLEIRAAVELLTRRKRGPKKREAKEQAA